MPARGNEVFNHFHTNKIKYKRKDHSIKVRCTFGTGRNISFIVHEQQFQSITVYLIAVSSHMVIKEHSNTNMIQPEAHGIQIRNNLSSNEAKNELNPNELNHRLLQRCLAEMETN